ncbi:hypothetical protein CGMCC3_g6189 [Colletotrichum fructicola]|nr:uncharacterized protein CGMCC3_g6189 [Colletotrichum fructicola]KAE9577889.1 hypothetical protein CGMCC3_g6189 [Colletotrichum fructicola]
MAEPYGDLLAELQSRTTETNMSVTEQRIPALKPTSHAEMATLPNSKPAQQRAVAVAAQVKVPDILKPGNIPRGFRPRRDFFSSFARHDVTAKSPQGIRHLIAAVSG